MHLIVQKTQSISETEILQFTENLQTLYAFPVFQDILNAAASLAKTGQMEFSLLEKRLYESNEGWCKTTLLSFYDKIRNRLVKNRQHLIIIKRNTENVIIHEIAHAIEKEIPKQIVLSFEDAMSSDLNNRGTANILVMKQVERTIIEEVSIYPTAEHLSERFARYFEIYCYSKEISRKHQIPISEYEKFFKQTAKWRSKLLFPYLQQKIIARELLETKAGKDSLPLKQRKEQRKWSQRVKSLFD